jgi:two-component system sensor histidine kinase PilS (NtrC family)
MDQPSLKTKPMNTEATLQRAIDESDLTWRVLGTLNLFRLFLAIALLGLFFGAGELRVFGERYPLIFSPIAAAYFVLPIVAGFSIHGRWVGAGLQTYTQIMLDIFSIVILMHTSGGIGSGLGGLLVVFVSAGSLILPMQVPGFFAAIAALAILGEQVFRKLVV